jgi:hypothetical protein
VVVYRRVPIMDTTDQRGYAYLHIRGSPRDLPSYRIRVFVGAHTVTARGAREHPAFAGEATTYNSPPVPGVAAPAAAGGALADEPGPYDVLVDISDALRRDEATDAADVTLLLTDLRDRPLEVSQFDFDDLTITRHR